MTRTGSGIAATAAARSQGTVAWPPSQARSTMPAAIAAARPFQYPIG